MNGLVLRYAEPEEWRKCLILVEDQYRARGFTRSHPGTPRWTLWHNVKETRVVIAERDSEIIATATLVFDGPLGLPCEGTFPDDVSRLRRDASCPRLAEMTCIASGEMIHNDSSTVPRMLKWTHDEALKDADILIGCAHPHHVLFWKKFLGAIAPTNEVKPASHAGGSPAVFGYMTHSIPDRHRHE